MSQPMQAPHQVDSKTLTIEKRKFDLLHLQGKQTLEPFPSNDKSLISQDKHLTCGYVYKGTVYIFDGIRTLSMLTTQKKQSGENLVKAYKQICTKQFLAGYNFYGSTLLNNEIYLLRTRQINSVVTDDMIKFNLSAGDYEFVESAGDKPLIRQAPLLESINNMYIVLYGGVLEKQHKIFDDAYIFSNGYWKQLKINGQIEPRYNFASTHHKGAIYVHGGQTIKSQDQDVRYFSDLYQLRISDTNYEITFQLLQPRSGPVPPARAQHYMTSLNERFLVMYGGLAQDIDSEEQGSPTVCKDVWLFDTYQKQWSQIKLSNDSAIKRLSRLSGILSDQNKIYIYGRCYDQQNKAKLELVRLEFPQQKDSLQAEKHRAIWQVSPEQEQCNDHPIQIATSLIHSTSYSIKFPFQAVQRIIQYAQIIHKSTYFRIHSQVTSNTIDKYIYISILFDTTQANMLNTLQGDVQFQRLPFYCLRLGKSVLYVHNNYTTRQRTVFFISSDGRFSPLVERIQIRYIYRQNILTGETKSKEDQRNKCLILKILESIIESPQEFIRQVQNNEIMIFSINIIPTAKTYYYELVFDTQTDIGLFKNNKKVQLFEKLKYDFNNCMEFSLLSYLAYAKADPFSKVINLEEKNDVHSNSSQLNGNSNGEKMKEERIKDEKDSADINGTENNSSQSEMRIFLSKSDDPVRQTMSYADYLHDFYKKDKLHKLQLASPNSGIKVPFVKYVRLYMCQQDFYLPQNNGMLVYQNGRLINRYGCEFGQMLIQKFYKKIFHKQRSNAFNIVGEIHVTNDLRLINFKTQFQNVRNYVTFRTSLERAILVAIQQIRPELINGKKAKSGKDANDGSSKKVHKQPKAPKQPKQNKQPKHSKQLRQLLRWQKQAKQLMQSKQAKQLMQSKQAKQSKQLKQAVQSKQAKQAIQSKQAKQAIQSKQAKYAKQAKQQNSNHIKSVTQSENISAGQQKKRKISQVQRQKQSQEWNKSSTTKKVKQDIAVNNSNLNSPKIIPNSNLSLNYSNSSH